MQNLLNINWQALLFSNAGKLLAIIIVILILSLCIDFFMSRSMFGRGYRFFVAPGIIVHELSHALMCLLTGAKIRSVSLFEKNGGSVEHTKSKIPIIGSILISMAPIFIGSFVIFFLSKIAGMDRLSVSFSEGFTSNFGQIVDNIKQIILSLDFHNTKTWILLYLVLSVAITMAPSKQDFRNIFSAIIIILIILILINKYTQYSFNVAWLITPEVLAFVATVILLLILSLGLSIILFAISKLFKIS